jgi:serine/threonine protein phosphatase PrpC
MDQIRSFIPPTRPNMEVQIARPLGFTEMGQRANNEDALFPAPALATAAQRWFLVCDGVGGAERGEVASQLAITAFDAFFRANPVAIATEPFIRKAVEYVEDQFNAYLPTNLQATGMATTVTLVYFHAAGATVAHIGDSRVYLVRNGQIAWRTDDHSYVNELVKGGVLTLDEARLHPQRNVITRALQGGPKRVHPAVQILNDLRPGDYFFLCSDGVLERVGDELLERTLGEQTTNETKLSRLREFSFNGQTRDNFTAYLIQVQQVFGNVDPAFRVATPAFVRAETAPSEAVSIIGAASDPQPISPVARPEPLRPPVRVATPEPVIPASVVPMTMPAQPTSAPTHFDQLLATRPPARAPRWLPYMLAGLFLAIGAGVVWYAFQDKLQKLVAPAGSSATSSASVAPVLPAQAGPVVAAPVAGPNSVAAEAAATESASRKSSSPTAVSETPIVSEKASADAPETARKTDPAGATAAMTVGKRIGPGIYVAQDETGAVGLTKNRTTWHLEPTFRQIDAFENGVAKATNGSGQTKFVSLDGKIFDEAGQPVCSAILVRKGAKYGYLNLNGQVTINLRYEAAKPFESSTCTAEVVEGGKSVVIDRKGKISGSGAGKATSVSKKS